MLSIWLEFFFLSLDPNVVISVIVFREIPLDITIGLEPRGLTLNAVSGIKLMMCTKSIVYNL